MRKVLNILQSTSMAFPKVTEDTVYMCVGHPLKSDITSIVTWLLNEPFSYTYRQIMDLKTLKGLALQDIVTQVHLFIHRICGKRKRRPWLGDLPIFKNHAPQQREQRLFEVKPFCPCFDFVSHRNGGSTNLHQVLCEKRIQGCRNFLDVANSLRGCRHEPKTSFRVVQALQGGSGRDRADNEHLTFDQKNARKETASLNLEAKTDDPELLKRVITGDETWIYGFDSETTQQASEWRFKNEPRPKKARKAPSKVKVMLTVFFDYQGIVHHEFQQQGSTITADSYLGVLRRLREAIRQKRPELGRSKSWILHHDNAPAHTALKISKFLQDHSTSVFPQPPYSPDLPPCDFLLFGNLKKS
ncbi:CLCN3 [Cordylochernes scorpioides]|uniref:CLCN3 n=1 Tax=Cordylochernes scorpioides TaxID=51811 RepID=A0ABY6JXC4_9ARAC|nr:CLCN3 [Cordylochernes scorpioides]